MPDYTPSVYQIMILGALQSKPIYAGTVPRATVERRRARNRVARVSRRINRVRGA